MYLVLPEWDRADELIDLISNIRRLESYRLQISRIMEGDRPERTDWLKVGFFPAMYALKTNRFVVIGWLQRADLDSSVILGTELSPQAPLTTTSSLQAWLLVVLHGNVLSTTHGSVRLVSQATYDLASGRVSGYMITRAEPCGREQFVGTIDFQPSPKPSGPLFNSFDRSRSDILQNICEPELGVSFYPEHEGKVESLFVFWHNAHVVLIAVKYTWSNSLPRRWTYNDSLVRKSSSTG